MNILGISAYYHDSAAAIIKNGEIIAAAQEERFTRVKHDPSFPANAVKFCLDYSGLSICDIDHIVFYDKPLLKFERLLETYYFYSPRGFKSFLMAIPVWLKEKLFLKNIIREEMSKIFTTKGKIPKILFSEHHLSHAASAYYPSPFNDAAILTIDGVGEWTTTAIFHGEGSNISLLKEMHFPNSWGLLYSAFTYYLGFKVNSGEYKLMGLAPYGDPNSGETKRFIKLIKENLIDLKNDGSIWMNMEYFDYPHGLTMTADDKWEDLFGLKRRIPETPLEQSHMNLAYAIQNVIEEGIVLLAKEAKRITGSKNLVLAGGVALNCVANGRILKSNIFENIWIQPASGDAGGAMGAALATLHIYLKSDRKSSLQKPDLLQGAFLGPEFSSLDIERTARKYNASYKKFESFDDLCKKTAKLLDGKKIIGWFQGRMEWGPRALGNRSILGDARDGEMQKRLNLKIKYRESFRPFAPSVLEEDIGDYFDSPVSSPYMLLVSDVVGPRRIKLPENYHSLPLNERLYFVRSDLPAITHLNFSARVQSVDKQTNPKYWKLIKEFKKLTGYGVIVNTSFNVRGEPIVCTPEDAYKCFIKTDMDCLVMGNYLFQKSLI